MQINVRKLLAVLAAVALLCTVLPLSGIVTLLAAGTNLVTNGDFESGTVGSVATGWTQYDSSYPSLVSTEDAHTGSQSVKLSYRQSRFVLRQDVTVEENTDYTISLYYRYTAEATRQYFLGAYTTASNGKYSNSDGVLIDSTATEVSTSVSNTAWTKLTYTFNSGSNTTVRIGIAGNSSSAKIYSADGFTLVDDVVLEKVGGSDSGDEPEVTITPDEEAANNLVVNGYFNDGNANGWTVSGGVVEAYNGDYMLKGTTTGRYATVAKQTISVKANTDYTLDMNALYVGGATQATARVHVYAADGSSDLVSGYYWTIQPGVMNAKQHAFNTGNNTQITIGVQQMAAASSSDAFDGNIYYDDFNLQEIIPAPEGNDTPSNDGYITNGDFETGDLTGWTIKHGGQINWIEVASGNFALEGTATAKYSPFISQTVTVEANTDYIITFKAKLAKAGGQVRFYVSPDGTTESNIASPYYFTSTTEWATYQLSFNSGSNTSLVVFPAQGVNDGGNIFYDDIVMEKATPGYQGLYPETMTSGADIRFMTYNVLVGKDESNGGYSWGGDITGRPEKAFAMINYYKPDVIAFEEFSGEWYDAFVAEMTDDYEFGEMISADADKNNGKLYTCLAYNKNTVRLLDTDLFRNTVSRWGTQGMRYVNVGFFEVIATGEKFIGAVTHPDAGDLVGTSDVNNDGVAEEGDGYWRPAMLEEAAAYVKGLSDEYNMPVVWGGDFNSGLEGTYDDNISWYKVADAGFTDATNGRYIDHIFYNDKATHLYETTVADAAVEGASDHKAVFADIQFLDEGTTPIRNLISGIKQQGRNYMKNGVLWLDFSASGIEFTANCEGTVALNLTVNSIKNTDATYGGIYFTVIVDGVKKDRALCRITETGNVTLTLAEGLSAGNHTFEVYRQTEHRGAEVGISSITMNGTIGTKPADSPYFIEFIGDSISTGYGALGVSSDASAESPKWQDATVAYPYLTAKALGVDFSDVCYSGIGAKYGWQDPNMHTFYPYQRWQYDRTTQYNFNSRQPNVVVIALGTNDIAMESEKGITVEQRLTGYQEFLDLVRAKNPNSKIIWIYGMMKDDDNARIPQIIENNGGAAAGLYSLELTTNTAGAGWHPSAAGQQAFANDLVAFINEKNLLTMGDEEDTANLITSEGSSVMDVVNGKMGVGFLFDVKVSGITKDEAHIGDYSNAIVTIDGVEYKLITMGAVVTNRAAIGIDEDLLKRSNLSNTVIDIPAEKVYQADADNAKFAVRIKNIPVANSATVIYARPYYVIEVGGEEVTVYDDIVGRSYDEKLDVNDDEFEW